MVPEEYRVINRALCLLTDEYQGEREMARTALHALFRQQLKDEKFMLKATDWIAEANDNLKKLLEGDDGSDNSLDV